ncbi:MAG: metallophosphoesterase [Planctomycetota bacterium]
MTLFSLQDAKKSRRTSLFVSDLHGRIGRYEKLFQAIGRERPRAVFLGGDLLPSARAVTPYSMSPPGFIRDCLVKPFARLRRELGTAHPHVFLILGNDDGCLGEPALREGEDAGLWQYVHNRKVPLDDVTVYGYACVPPTPFLLKDWERYDVSRYTEPGAISPEEGIRTGSVPADVPRFATIKNDLASLAGNESLERSVFLFHTPPHDTALDLAAIAGKKVDHAPLDPHVGSIAVRRFIEERQPLLTLHGHIHESARLTGEWRDRIGRTRMFSAAHDGPELALVRFDLEDLDGASRELL